jgi:hypothetical protein
MRGPSAISLDSFKDRHEAFIIARASEIGHVMRHLTGWAVRDPSPPQPDRPSGEPRLLTGRGFSFRVAGLPTHSGSTSRKPSAGRKVMIQVS